MEKPQRQGDDPQPDLEDSQKNDAILAGGEDEPVSPDDEVFEIAFLLALEKQIDLKVEDWKTVREYLRKVVRNRGRSNLPSGMDESDIVQESMIEIQKDFANLKGKTPAQIKTWLKRLVENNVIDAFRREETAKRKPEGEVRLLRIEEDLIRDENGSTASSVFTKNEMDMALYRAVAALPPEHQQLLEMRHKDAMSFAEIGESLGISEQAAWKRWSRIVEQLRHDLKHDS